jgi:hypothetical protein
MPKLILAFLIGAACGFGFHFVPAALRDGQGETASPATPSLDRVEERARAILSSDDPVRRVAEISALLPELTPEAVPALVRAFESAPLDGGDPEIVVFALWWAGFDPQAAREWTRTDWRASYGSVIAAVFRGWAHKDPRQAWGNSQGVGFTVQRELAMDAAMAGWDESGEPGLVEAVQQLGNVDQQRIGETLARRRVVMLGPEGALRWVDSIGDQGFREVMAVRVAGAAAAHKGAGPLAAEWAAQHVRTDDRLSGFPRRIGSRWARYDPEGALAWLATLPAGADRDDGVGETYRSWMVHDRAAAFAWADKSGLQPWNQPAISLYVRALSRENPQKAIELAHQLSDPGLRDSSTIVVGRVWIEIDRDAAEAWFERAGISESVREQARLTGANSVRERNMGRRQRSTALDAQQVIN